MLQPGATLHFRHWALSKWAAPTTKRLRIDPLAPQQEDEAAAAPAVAQSAAAVPIHGFSEVTGRHLHLYVFSAVLVEAVVAVDRSSNTGCHV